MPTLAEILAKKNIRKGGSSTADDVTGASSVGGSGPVIRAEDERPKLAAVIKQALDASAPTMLPKSQPPAPRELGATQEGERLPMDHPPQGAPDEAWEWFDSLHSFESDMGIVIEPDSGHAWLAVQARQFQPPLLILRLPLLNRPQAGNPF